MHYVDASVLVAAVTDEPLRFTAREWIDAQDGDLLLSKWVLTEVASALSIKVRERVLNEASKAVAAQQVELLRETFFRCISVDDAHFDSARRLASWHQTGLRGGDALHVAIAADYACALVTLDKRMAKGARLVGLEVVELPQLAQ